MFRVILATTSDYVAEQLQPISLCNGDTAFSNVQTEFFNSK